MPPPYRIPHWKVFSTTPHVAAGAVGVSPVGWVRTHQLSGVPLGAIPLPALPLGRAAVRAICQNPANPVLFGYVCAMAWGGQGCTPKTKHYVGSAWAANATIAHHLNALRAGGLTSCQAYNLFLGAPVRGLGPAFFTKLLYFFSPQPDCYIMDQWASKSVNLLTGSWVVRMTPEASVHNQNKCGNYEAYCDEVDAMATLIGGVTGEQVEEMMMSRGGNAPWPWRAHVNASWPVCAPVGNYNRAALRVGYKHIASTCF